MVSLFVWNDNFLTKIPLVDQQHGKLVDLINDLGEQVMADHEIVPNAFLPIRDDLINYINVHFSDEELLMHNVGLDSRFQRMHRNDHQAFVDEVQGLCCIKGTISHEQAKGLTEYLVHWLAYHILEIDHGMARQIRLVQAGVPPAEAYEKEFKLAKPNVEPLLTAMSGLFYIVTERNRELRALNEELERRVSERTAELENANLQLNMLATQDDLTNLPNRRFAMLSLRQLMKEGDRYNNKFSIMVIDVDRFKQVNDRFGHPEGDRVLATISKRLRRSIRGCDIVCRIGGDEFLVICPHSDSKSAAVVARKILSESAPILAYEETVCWDGSLSIGIAEAKPNIASPEDLLKIADDAMYAAKAQGGFCMA